MIAYGTHWRWTLLNKSVVNKRRWLQHVQRMEACRPRGKKDVGTPRKTKTALWIRNKFKTYSWREHDGDNIRNYTYNFTQNALRCFDYNTTTGNYVQYCSGSPRDSGYIGRPSGPSPSGLYLALVIRVSTILCNCIQFHTQTFDWGHITRSILSAFSETLHWCHYYYFAMVYQYTLNMKVASNSYFVD